MSGRTEPNRDHQANSDAQPRPCHGYPDTHTSSQVNSRANSDPYTSTATGLQGLAPGLT